MSLEQELRNAQHVLDRCDGNLAEAMTYAAFRIRVTTVMRNHWPRFGMIEPVKAQDGWEPCCDHCGCEGQERIGHDDTCAYGCNDK